MLNAAFLRVFKGGDTLLIWGDNAGMSDLREGLLALGSGQSSSFVISGGAGLTSLTINPIFAVGVSTIAGSEDHLIWTCSSALLPDLIVSIEPLSPAASGHQYADVQSALVEQVMISVNEYPENFRR